MSITVSVPALRTPAGIRVEAAVCIGGKVNDLEAMATVGLSACPAAAVAKAREKAQIACACARSGGGVLGAPGDILLAARRAAQP